MTCTRVRRSAQRVAQRLHPPPRRARAVAVRESRVRAHAGGVRPAVVGRRAPPGERRQRQPPAHLAAGGRRRERRRDAAVHADAAPGGCEGEARVYSLIRVHTTRRHSPTQRHTPARVYTSTPKHTRLHLRPARHT